MKKTLTIIQIALLTLALITGHATDRETRNLDAFSGVSVSSGVNAKLIQGTHNEISIEVDGIEIDRVKTYIKNDVLVVSVKHKKFWFGSWGKKDIDVVITYTEDLSKLKASSGSNLIADHTIFADELDIDISSGAHMELDVKAYEVNIDLSSGSVGRLSGVSKVAYVESSSGAHLQAYDLRTDKASADGSSGSSIQITVVNDLRADVSSGASVRYKGDPQRDIDKSSGGSVKQVSVGI